MAIGRPITLTANVASKTISITATAGQTLFQPSGGYRINQIAVFRNGTRLVDGQDFTARDGASVTLLSGATAGDVLEFQIFDSFNVSAAINDNGNQTLDGALVVTGGVTGSQIGFQSGGTAIGVARTVNFIGSGNTVIDKGDGTLDGTLIVTGGVTGSQIGNQSGGTAIGTGRTVNFIGSGNTVIDKGDGTIDVSISGGGGGGGLGTALSDDSTKLLSHIFITPRQDSVAAGTSVTVESGVGGGGIAFTKLNRIDVGTGATFHVGSGTTLIMDVLNIF